MSTCRGAAMPHDNCPHGKRCDWLPPSQERDCRVTKAGTRQYR